MQPRHLGPRPYSRPVQLAALPEWLDPEMLTWIILVVIAVLIYSMYLVVRFIQRVVLRSVLFVALAGLGLSLWVQRTDLENCARSCECSLYGQTVEIPWEQLPEDVRVRLADGEVGCRPIVEA